MLDALYFMDMILKFFTGIPFEVKPIQDHDKVTENEIAVGYIYSYKKIAYNYLKTTFFIDLLSIIPFLS